MTSYERDTQGTRADAFDDNVGKPARRRGKKCVPSTNTAATQPIPGGNTFMAPKLAAEGGSASGRHGPELRAGHVPGYMGHVPEGRAHAFNGGDAQMRSHDKSFFLMPDNFKQQMPGYTGRDMEYNKYSALCDRGRH